MSLSERLAGFVPDEPVVQPYPVPPQLPWPPDARIPAWQRAATAAAPVSAAAPSSETVAWVAPRRSERSDPTVLIEAQPTRRVVPATPPRAAAASSGVQPWEWDDRRHLRVAVLVASIALVLGAGAAGVILVRHGRSIADTTAAPDTGLPSPLPVEVATIPPIEIGGPAVASNSGTAPEPPSVVPVTPPIASTSTTGRPAPLLKPPPSQGLVAAPPQTLNPPSPPVRPTRPQYTSTSTTQPATTTTSTTRPPTTTTTQNPNRSR